MTARPHRNPSSRTGLRAGRPAGRPAGTRAGRRTGTSVRALTEALERRVFLSAGNLDHTFGLGGTIVTHVSANDDAVHAVDVLPDGKVLAAGSADGGRFAVVRYTADGFPDPTFGRGGADGDGVVTVDLGPNGGDAEAVAQLPGGKFLVAGSVDGAHGLALVRFNADGTLDPTFAPGGIDGDGVATVNFRPGYHAAAGTSMVLQPDGKILVGGTYTTEPFQWQWALARFTPGGQLDASFGPAGNGVVITPVPQPGPSLLTRCNALALAPGGGILAAGGTGHDLAVIKYTPDGRIDSTFARGGADGDGVLIADFGGDDAANDLAVLPDGKFLVAGGSVNGGPGVDRAFVARYRRDGTPDPTFGNGGRFEIGGGAISAGATSARFTAIAVQGDGKIVAGGDFFNDWPNYNDMLLVRLTPAGQLDPTFQGADSYFDVPPGIVNVMIRPLSQDFADDLAIGPDGRVVIAGTTFTGQGSPTGEFALARYLNDVAPAGTRAYEAELAAVSGAAVSTQFGGYGGSGFVDYANARGDSVEFTVDAPAAGQYELAFRYANGAAAARGMGLSVGGAPVAGGVSFAPTGSWSAWKTTTVGVTLPAGATTVRLRATGQSGPNLDSLALRPVQPPPAVYQAEGADLSGPMTATDVRGYTGSGFADFPPTGASAEFLIDVPSDGTYALDFRYGNGAPADRPLELQLDGTVAGAPIPFSPTGTWRNWQTARRTVFLTAGRHTVRLASVGPNGPNLDSLTVALVVTPPTPQPVTLQAESAALAGPLAAANHVGYTGTGFADYQNGAGDSVEFTYDAPVDRDYTLEFRYANGGLSDRPLELRVDGNVLDARLSFAPTGTWSTWEDVTQPAVLTAGRHTVRLTSVGSNGPNLDALTVRPGPSPAALTYLSQSRSIDGALRERFDVVNPDTGEVDHPITEQAGDSRAAPDFGDFDAAISVQVTPPPGWESGIVEASQHSRLADNGIFVSGAFNAHTGTQDGGYGINSDVDVSFELSRPRAYVLNYNYVLDTSALPRVTMSLTRVGGETVFDVRPFVEPVSGPTGTGDGTLDAGLYRFVLHYAVGGDVGTQGPYSVALALNP